MFHVSVTVSAMSATSDGTLQPVMTVQVLPECRIYLLLAKSVGSGPTPDYQCAAGVGTVTVRRVVRLMVGGAEQGLPTRRW